jgi:[acyl-carrier-protein] S-malonyltransferase
MFFKMSILSSQTAFLFPGQGSQHIGMGKDLAEKYPTAKETFHQANNWLGYPISKLIWEGPEEDLNDTINTQPALLIHSIAALSVLQEQYPDFKPIYVAGHSMGELTALFAAGALSYQDALNLVHKRGELMKQAGLSNPGGMAAIIGLDIPALEDICQQASTDDEVVQVANDNCPGQVVISGVNSALERAMKIAKEAGARYIRRLAVSIAAHSPLMAESQSEFEYEINQTQFKDPITHMIGNVNAQPLTKITEIQSDLKAQLTSRVRWTESITTMVEHGVTTFIEIGSGSVLTGLLRRIDRRIKGYPLGTVGDFEKFNTLV